MKKKRILAFGIAVIMCSFGLFATGCDDEDQVSSGTYIDGSTTSQKGIDENADMNADTTQNNMDIKHTTVSQPYVNTDDFPDNYLELEKAVYNAMALPKSTRNGKTTGSDTIKLISSHKGKIDKKLQNDVKKEIVNAVNEQVPGVNCTNATLTVSENDPNMGLITIYFIYDETGGSDVKIFNIGLG